MSRGRTPLNPRSFAPPPRAPQALGNQKLGDVPTFLRQTFNRKDVVAGIDAWSWDYKRRFIDTGARPRGPPRTCTCAPR